ncbi:MAG: hypothetical protein M5U19_05335 [Microthrixaceae bacterium]|nr:hypothetical protein [Microthrixaceae bacterium]
MDHAHENPDDLDEGSYEDPLIADLGATLRAALNPRGDVRDKARHRVDRALHARSAATGITSMGGCALDTIRHLLTNPPRSADRYPMSEPHLGTDPADRPSGSQDPEADRD